MSHAESASIRLSQIKETLWKAAEYKHVVLGLILLKYISDSFEEHRAALRRRFADDAGFCKVATLDEIERNDFVLTPGRYVGAAKAAAGGQPFAERMRHLTGELRDQFAESDRLQRAIRDNLRSLGYEI